MLFTERKALEEMFRYLEDDKRTIKAQARQDIENIENRQMVLLDRLERLDKVDRESVDVEGVLQSLAATTKELAALIPSVPFTDVLERAASKIAEAPENRERINAQPQRNIMREKIVEAAKIQKLQEPVKKPAPRETRKHQPKGIGKAEGLLFLISILKDMGRPMKAGALQKEFEKQTGVIYANFHSKIKEWITHDPGKIVKEGFYYKLKEHDSNGEQPSTNPEEKTHNEPGNRSETYS